MRKMNTTSASLLVQTILVFVNSKNATQVTNLPTFPDDAEYERCYGIYGCFAISYPWSENRPENMFPETPESLRIRYPTFTRRNRLIPVLLEADKPDRIREANIDPRGPFYLISHGFLESGDKPWIENMMNALLNLEGNKDATVFIVDWRGGSQPPYGQAVANIRLIGAMTAHFIHHVYEVLELPNIDNFHFIGHSLGAHLAGYCGHELYRTFSLRLGRITGLDPAAPYFTRTVTAVRLDRTDAKFVDIIHSNAKPLYAAGLGISEPVGHVDFYPNGGSSQPGCRRNSASGSSDGTYQAVAKYVGCDHERSHEFFTESINPTCPFIGVQCDSYQSFLLGKCTTCDKYHICLPMGYHSYSAYSKLQIDSGTPITLYLMTGPTKPYCRIHYFVTLKVSNSSQSIRAGPDYGKVCVKIVDRENVKSDCKNLSEEKKYYKPGDLETAMVALKDTGHSPNSAIVEWDHEMLLYDPSSWRLTKASSIYVEYVKLVSIEYDTEITVCPMQNTPIVDNVPVLMKTKYCPQN